MGLGNINTVERFQRLTAIKELLDEDFTDNEIAEELGMTVQTVRRNKKYLKELSISDLKPQDIAEKRAELYVELMGASSEAKGMYDKYKEEDKGLLARNFFISWMETIQLRMKLYGLDAVKVDSLTQINNISYIEPDKIDLDAGRKIADAIVRSHEKKNQDA